MIEIKKVDEDWAVKMKLKYINLEPTEKEKIVIEGYKK